MLFRSSVVHLIYPVALVRSCVAWRDQRMTLTAGLTFFQISLDNVLTAAMALMGYGVWAAVAPKIVVAILWTIIVLLTVDPRPRAKITRAKLWDVIAYSRRVLGAESLNTFRANADKMIVGKFLGMEADRKSTRLNSSH